MLSVIMYTDMDRPYVLRKLTDLILSCPLVDAWCNINANVKDTWKYAGSDGDTD